MLVPGRPLTGHIDHSLDTDHYFVDLVAGQNITITVDSVAIDPQVFISPVAEYDILDYDDDGGGGLLGYNSELTFTANKSGRYVIGANDFFGDSSGGYVIAISSSGGALAAGSGAIVGGSMPALGLGLIVFSGGTTEQLIAAAACETGEARFFVLAGGRWLTLIPAAPASVNAAWNVHFAGGIPANTPIVGLCRG